MAQASDRGVEVCLTKELKQLKREMARLRKNNGRLTFERNDLKKQVNIFADRLKYGDDACRPCGSPPRRIIECLVACLLLPARRVGSSSEIRGQATFGRLAVAAAAVGVDRTRTGGSLYAHLARGGGVSSAVSSVAAVAEETAEKGSSRALVDSAEAGFSVTHRATVRRSWLLVCYL